MVPLTIPASEDFADPDISIGRIIRVFRRGAFLARANFKDWVERDIAAIGVWAPVAIGAGAGVYFGLKAEPPILTAFAVLLMTGVFVVVARRFSPGRLSVAAAASFLAATGFAAADLRTAYVDAPILPAELDIRSVNGKVISVEERARDQRYILELHAIEGVAAADTPARARISWRGERATLTPGDRVTLRAGLGPPPPPAAPGGFDFGRQLYFRKIGAVGFAVTTPQTIDAPALSMREKLTARIEALRAHLFERITTKAPGEGGAIIAAIVTGKRDAITDRADAALRDTGLAHLLAISGLHMGLVTGLIFFGVRATFAAIEPLALKFPIKKWAAIAALGAGLFYLVISGGSWSARRAFIMTAIIFAAILADRRALSLRNVAIAATIVLLTTPEAIFHPGFQMSFAAVTALIAGFEWASKHANPNRSFTLPARIKRYAIGVAATDTIAAIATAPFALYHFNRVALYSLPANIAAMPMMAFWIAPTAVVAVMLVPLGIDGPVWRLSAAGMEAILAIASEIAALPGAVSLTKQWPLFALVSLSVGGLWLCLLRSPLRLFGFVALPLSIGAVALTPAPNIFVSAKGLNAGVIVDDKLYMYTNRRDRFSAMVWREYAGLNLDAPDEGARRAPRLSDLTKIASCEPGACVVAMPDGAISIIEDGAFLAEDCARADLVIALFPVSSRDWSACQAMLVDRRSVWRRGAHAIQFKDGNAHIRTVRDARGNRPWTGDD